METTNAERALNVERTLVEIFKNYTNSQVETIHWESNLRQDLGLSSFDMIALCTEIEGSFSITIDGVDALAWGETVGDIVNLITKKIAQ